jgi:Fe2+ transport system protein FeoA
VGAGLETRLPLMAAARRPSAGYLRFSLKLCARIGPLVIPDSQIPVPLTTVDVGVSARLHTTRLDDETRSLLRSLGLTDASRLRVCKCGEPLIIQVRATRIGLSSAVAGNIYVVLEGEPRQASGHASHAADS